MKRRRKRRDAQRKKIERRLRQRKRLPNKSRESVRNVRGSYLRANRTRRASKTRSLESHHLHHRNQSIPPIELECIIVTLYL